MKIVGLTGGIGSGKTTVLKMFQQLGASVYIADAEAKKLMHTNKKLMQEITDLFGKEAYINNKLNKQYIANVVFNNKEKLEELNKLVHPKVREHFFEFVKNSNSSIVIYEAAILFESKSNTFCDFVITVVSNNEERVKRIIKRDGLTKQQVLDRMKNQTTDEYKIKKSNFVIKNDSLDNTKNQVLTIFNLVSKLQ
ncbi:dephospho-CoA kinase [Lutibacter sp.]